MDSGESLLTSLEVGDAARYGVANNASKSMGKGNTVRPIETVANPASTPRVGLFAVLCVLFHVKGTGASKTSRRPILSVLAMTLGALAFTTAPALASGGHVFKESFNGGAGHELSDPTGIAVNNATGNVYVVDKGNNRVEEFNPAGTEVIAEFGKEGSGSGELSEPEAIAIDNSGETQAEDPSVGDLYVTDHNVVDKFSATGGYEGQITTGEGGAPLEEMDGVAVDPKGQLWVYQKNEQIDTFSDAPPNGDAQPNAFVSSVNSPATSPTDPGFAVNSEDDLYVAHAEEEVKIAKLNSKGEELEPELGGSSGKTGVAVEAASNDVYIDSGNPESGAPAIQEFTAGSKEIESFGQKQLAGRGGTALAVSYANISRGDAYVVDSAEGKVDIFTPPKVTAHVFGFSFGKEGSGAGEFVNPTGVAVNDETGDAYVVDKGNNRVEYFSAVGVYEGEFNGSGMNLNEGVNKPATGRFVEPESIAVDNDPGSPSYGDVYVTDNGHKVVDKFGATGEYKGQIAGTCEAGNEVPPACEPSKTFIPFAALVGVAVDANGTVWVAQRSRAGQTGEIDAFSGEEPNGFLSRREPQTGGSDLLHPGFAVDSTDNLYVTLERAAGDLVAELDSEGKALETSGAEDFCGQPPDLRTGVVVDLSSEDVLLDYGTSIGECNSGGSPLETFGSGDLTGGSGLGVNATSGAVYVADSAANDVDIFDEDFLPQVAVGAVSALTPSSVTLEGHVTPEGRPVSSCEFEYGTTTSYGQSVPCETEHGASIGDGTKAVPVTAKLSGLSSGMTYHYRLVASSVAGTNRSADFELKTLGPEISAEEFNFVEATSATLQAQIDPNGSATSYHFEYDTRPYAEGEGSHGTPLPAPSASLGSGKSPVPVSVKLQGLHPGTTYYFRAAAESELQGAPHLFDGESQTFTTSPPPSAGSCPNEQRRAEQPFGLTLPDCRAYELVSPEETGGQDATGSFNNGLPNARASEAKEEEPAITYASKGSFGSPTGATNIDQFVSRREPAKDRWVTQAITPLWNPSETEAADSSFEATVFTPELTAGIAGTDASLTSEAPSSFVGKGLFGMYVADFADDSYRYVGLGLKPLGASTDLSHVVFGEHEEVFEWVDGTTVPVSVTNSGAPIEAAVGSQHAHGYADIHEVWHAVSANGSRVYFTSPAEPPSSSSSGGGPGALYVRVNVEQPQSPLANPEVSATGTLEKGSDAVTGLITTSGVLNNAAGGGLQAGATLYPFYATNGKFRVGQHVSGQGIAPGTEITQIVSPPTGCYGGEAECLELSIPTTKTISAGAQIYFSGPEPLEVGEKITGEGIPSGTTITAAKSGELTLSEPAGASTSGEALHAGGECTVPADACTIEVSASQRARENPAGTQPARYWGASADGSRTFFTSASELTEDAYTGAHGEGANLYEYDPATGKLNDLTGEATDSTGNGADVQGVVQISEVGSYVYFVAKGALKGAHGKALRNASGVEPLTGEANLYVSYEGGAPAFIATLAAGDSTDWHAASTEDGSGPQINTAVVNPSGSRLAFLSERSLTGYDNEQAKAGECEQEVDNRSETGRCRELYLFDAETPGLVCASCNPTGARPVGPSGFGKHAEESALYRARNLLEDGTLFFDSSDALVPHAKDGRQNVYEYEEAQIHAISDVAGGGESFFLDASANGEDVFFGSADQLLKQDTGDNVVVWDARQDGGFPFPAAAPACTTAEACRAASPSTPGVFGAPPSATFSGPGNLAPPVVKPAVKPKTLTRAQKLAAALKSCKKDKKKAKRQTCEKQARAKYGPAKEKAKAKRATNDRRASR
jgi:DNA-binding beta-propeller fold protein YncE